MQVYLVEDVGLSFSFKHAAATIAAKLMEKQQKTAELLIKL
jgi:hypothetical protein